MTADERTVRRYASDELLNYFADNPRPTAAAAPLPPKESGSVKVWVVVDELDQADGDDEDVAVAAVHASEQGAQDNLTPDGKHGCKSTSPRRRWVLEMELLP